MAMTPHDDQQAADRDSSGAQPGKQPGKHADERSGEDTSHFPPLSRWLLWADEPRKVWLLIRGLAGVCIVLFVFDLFIDRHAEVPGEAIPGYYAIVGFIFFTLIVLGAKNLRRLIRRDENYYAPYGVDAERYPEAGTGVQRYDATQDSGGGDGPAAPRQTHTDEQPDVER